MSRRQGLYAPDPKDTTLTRSRWAEYRRAWRTLMCLSRCVRETASLPYWFWLTAPSWIPFTAGYNEDHADAIARTYVSQT